jgi:hypothetical protein
VIKDESIKVHKFPTISSVKIVFLPLLLPFTSQVFTTRMAHDGKEEFLLKWKIWSTLREEVSERSGVEWKQQTCHKFVDKCAQNMCCILIIHLCYLCCAWRCSWTIQKMRLKYQHNTACLHILNEIFIAHNLLSSLPQFLHKPQSTISMCVWVGGEQLDHEIVFSFHL